MYIIYNAQNVFNINLYLTILVGEQEGKRSLGKPRPKRKKLLNMM
jgi:hypothetical protein